MDPSGIICGDCLEVMPTLADSSVDLIVADPPYFKVKGEWWDRQWDKPECFLKWLGQVFDEWQRLLKPNGSIYCFASPQMAWHVEGEIRKRFNVLNSIRWQKDSGWAGRQEKEECRTYFPQSETIIFAEHHNSDSYASGESQWGAKCDELRGFVFEPLRAYLDGERKRAGISCRQIAERIGTSTTMVSQHYMSQSQWGLPTEDVYEAMQSLFNAQCNGSGPEYLRRDYEYLRRDYEYLRAEYEQLRRPFNVTANDQYTDVWTFPTVGDFQGKHPCEKPAELLNQIMRASGREGCTVLDCFAGSCSTLIAAQSHGYNAVGIEIDEAWVERGKRNIARGNTYNPPTVKQPARCDGQRELFA